MRIEVIVRADQVEAVVEAIADAARTAKVGDGKIIVTDADLIVRIRTGERDEHSV
jgi:nitrogen regulatory protein P-II 1